MRKPNRKVLAGQVRHGSMDERRPEGPEDRSSNLRPDTSSAGAHDTKTKAGTMTNPFAPNVPAQQEPVQQPAAPVNPYAQQQPVAAPAAPVQSNPFAQPAPAPVTPQAYAQPAYAPQQAAPQAYAPPTQPVQQAAPPALNPGGIVAAGAPVVGEGRGAKLPDLYGRLLLMIPLGIATVARNPKYITDEQRQRGDLTQQRMTVTVVALDDGQGGMQPVGFGGAPHGLPPIPHTEFAPLPYVRKGMWINQSRLISQLEPHLTSDPRQPGMVCGRLVKAGPAATDAWYLNSEVTEQELNLARTYMQLVAAGQYPHPLA